MIWNDLFPTILNMSLTASVIIVAVLLVRLLLKKAPKVFAYALWAVVLFRLLCPVAISSDISLFNVFDAPVTESGRIEYIPSGTGVTPPANGGTVSTAPPQGAEQQPATPQPAPDNSGVILDPPAADLPQTDLPLTETPQPAADPLELAMTAARYIWLGGIAALLIYSIVQMIRLRRSLVGAVALRGNIYLSDYIASPFVLGLFRPKIYLPSTLRQEEQGYVILHEKHHIRRCDHLIKMLAFIALCIHWFNPLVWVAFALSSKDMEMSCDEAVMKKMTTDIRADYSASLLRFATNRSRIAGAPLAFGEGDTKSRIKNVMRYKKPTLWAILAALILCVAMAGCFLTNPNGTLPGGDEPDPMEQEYPELTELLSLSVEEIRSKYGTLTLEYSENGPGQPVYSMANYPGVHLVFTNWDMAEPLAEDMTPAELILTAGYKNSVKGLAVGTTVESGGVITAWDDAGCDMVNGTPYASVSVGKYSLTAIMSSSALGLHADDILTDEDWAAWSETYRQAPTGEILQLRLKKIAAEDDNSPDGAELLRILENEGDLQLRTVTIPVGNASYRLWQYDETHTLCLVRSAGGSQTPHLYLIDGAAGAIAADCPVEGADEVTSIAYTDDGVLLYEIAGSQPEVAAFRILYDGASLTAEPTGLSRYPVVSNLPVTSPNGIYTAYGREDDAEGNGGVHVRSSDGTDRAILSHSDAGNVTTLRYHPFGFLSDMQLVYRISGYEWTRGYGIYDLKTGETQEFTNGDSVCGISEGFLYVTESDGNYGTAAWWKVSPDGSAKTLLASSDPADGVRTLPAELWGAFRNGNWLLPAAADGAATTRVEICSPDFDQTLAVVEFPGDYDAILPGGEGAYTILIPVDSQQQTPTTPVSVTIPEGIPADAVAEPIVYEKTTFSEFEEGDTIVERCGDAYDQMLMANRGTVQFADVDHDGELEAIETWPVHMRDVNTCQIHDIRDGEIYTASIPLAAAQIGADYLPNSNTFALYYVRNGISEVFAGQAAIYGDTIWKWGTNAYVASDWEDAHRVTVTSSDTSILEGRSWNYFEDLGVHSMGGFDLGVEFTEISFDPQAQTMRYYTGLCESGGGVYYEGAYALDASGVFTAALTDARSGKTADFTFTVEAFPDWNYQLGTTEYIAITLTSCSDDAYSDRIGQRLVYTTDAYFRNGLIDNVPDREPTSTPATDEPDWSNLLRDVVGDANLSLLSHRNGWPSDVGVWHYFENLGYPDGIKDISFEFDPLNRAMSWKVGYVASEYENTYSGTFAPVGENNYRAELYDPLRGESAEMIFRVQYFTGLDYGVGETEYLEIVILSCTDPDYDDLVGQWIIYTSDENAWAQ